MRLVVALLLALHGLAHLAGVRESLQPSAPSKRGSSYLGPKAQAVLWVLLAGAFVASAALLAIEREAWSPLLLLSSAASFGMCLLAWPQAKLGVFINAALLVLTVLLAPRRGPSLLAAFEREARARALPDRPPPTELVDEQSIAELPAPVRRYLKFMGAVGRPRAWSLRAEFDARFRRKPGPWSDCQAVSYDVRRPVTRLFMMKLSLNLLPVTVRDAYGDGRGTMQAKVFDLFPIVDASGPELDVGELVTYLNDAVLMAPSLLLGPETSWRAVDDRSFDVTLRDRTQEVTARVWLDGRGAPLDFSTTDRFFDAPDGRRVRTEWRTPIEGWQAAGDRMVPTRAQAVWQLEDGPFAYADFRFDPRRIQLDVKPGRD